MDTEVKPKEFVYVTWNITGDYLKLIGVHKTKAGAEAFYKEWKCGKSYVIQEVTLSE